MSDPIILKVEEAFLESDIPAYEGSYAVTPSMEQQTLATGGKRMTEDVTIEAMPKGTIGLSASQSGATVTFGANVRTDGFVDNGDDVFDEYTYPTATYKQPTFTYKAPTVSPERQAMVECFIQVQDAGYASGDLESSFNVADVLPTEEGKTVTPTRSTQTAAAKNKWVTGDIEVAPIPPEYIVPEGNIEITDFGTVNVAQYASATVNIQDAQGVSF